jgi:transcriptional regulator with XRE-family HTH domain
MPRLRDGGKERMAKIGLTPAQCRAARSALGLSQKKLAAAAEVSLPVVQEFEGRAGRVPLEKNLRDMRNALLRLGVRFEVVEPGRAAVFFVDKQAKLAAAGDGDDDAGGNA